MTGQSVLKVNLISAVKRIAVTVPEQVWLVHLYSPKTNLDVLEDVLENLDDLHDLDSIT